MKKPAAIILLIVTISILFAGAVSAVDAEVNVTVINEDSTPVIISNPGDEVSAIVKVSTNDETINDPEVLFLITPQTGLQFIPEEASMWDGNQWVQNDPNNPAKYFFYSNDGQWTWNINLIWGNMQPNDETSLIAPAIVERIGNIKTYAAFGEKIDPNGITVNGEDSYTFQSVERTTTDDSTTDNDSSVNAATVPMQNTGIPITAAILGLLGIIGGVVYSKFQ